MFFLKKSVKKAYKGIRKADGIKVPTGEKWFSHVRPDESWDGIRDMLNTTEQISV